MQTTTTRPSSGVEKTFDTRPAGSTTSLSLATVLAGIETKFDAYTSHRQRRASGGRTGPR